MEVHNGQRNNHVLIETYWNVNLQFQKRSERIRLVLIETYWNVNDIKLGLDRQIVGLNRNILECKSCI